MHLSKSHIWPLSHRFPSPVLDRKALWFFKKVLDVGYMRFQASIIVRC